MNAHPYPNPMSPEEMIVYIARVSSSREDKGEEPDKLIAYLIKNRHWSPFQHSYVTFEIKTSRAIGVQLLRHLSFTFQEVSQRYTSDLITVNGEDGMFEDIELRPAAKTNRQGSLDEEFNPQVYKSMGDPYLCPASERGKALLEEIEDFYFDLIAAGVAPEVARMYLPLCTRTTMYMTGSLRSWIHFLQIRKEGHAQKEARLIAEGIDKDLSEIFPNVWKALRWYDKVFNDGVKSLTEYKQERDLLLWFQTMSQEEQAKHIVKLDKLLN
jgi:thymidylate synthase (FAD)